MFIRPSMIFAMPALVLALTVAAPAGANAFDPPPRTVTADAPAAVPSRMSATIEFSRSALVRLLQRDIPRRVATFRSGGKRCWQRRIFGRMVHVDCAYAGYVERSGPISLETGGEWLRAAVPLYGTVSAHGLNGLASLLRGNGEARATVVINARPQLTPDWSIALNMREGFHWREAPTMNVLGFTIDATRFVEPQMRRHLGSVERDINAKVRAVDLRGKAEMAWQRAFSTFKVADGPDVWVRSTPQSIAFSGLHGRGDVLTASVEIAGVTETFIGAEPSTQAPTPLPQLGQAVASPGSFELIVPVQIDYATISQKVKDAFASVVPLRDVSIYPSAGKLVVVLHIDGAPLGLTSGPEPLIYLTATPSVDTDSQTIRLSDLAQIKGSMDGLPDKLVALLRDGRVIEQARQQIEIAYQGITDGTLASANARLNRSLGGGLRSEGKLTTLGAGSVSLLGDGLRINFRAAGQLKLLWSL